MKAFQLVKFMKKVLANREVSIYDGISKIKIVAHENQDAAVDVAPNDPLFLMDDNCFLCKEGTNLELYRNEGRIEDLEPPFELYTDKGRHSGEVDLPIKYMKDGDIATANVKLRFSIVKNKFYNRKAVPGEPGRTPLGKYAARLEGISVIRARREIDFRKFDFYSSVNEPTHRWWGCEIIFDPELDEAFGVANNKQYVELKEVDIHDLDDADVHPVWHQLSTVIIPTIRAMHYQNEEIRERSRSFDKTTSQSTAIVNSVEHDPANIDDTKSITEPQPTEEETAEKGKEALKDLGYENPTDEQGRAFVNNAINFEYVAQGERCPAFDYKTVLSSIVITINTSHQFYTSFLQKICNSDIEAKTTFELVLASLFMSVKNTDSYQHDQNNMLLTMWNNKLNCYIAEQLNPRNSK